MSRDEQMLHERLAGASLREIGERRALTAEGARLVVVEEARRQIDKLELDLLAAVKTDEFPTF